MIKFQRNYLLTIQNIDGTMINIQPPLTLEFNIQRNILSSANTCTFRVYNISSKKRTQIIKNQYDYDNLKSLTLQAGYGPGPQWPLLFSGNITQAYSVREGVDYVTEIEAYDAGFAWANAQFAGTFPEGTPQQNVVQSLVNSLQQFGVQPGKIGSYSGTTQAADSYVGNTCDILRDITGRGFFIDNNRAHCLNDFEVFAGEVQVINSASGLLGTPRREQWWINLDILFEPRLAIGQQIQLQSQTAANYNGNYKVIGLGHRGIISPVVCGEAVTSVQMFMSTKQFVLVD